MRRYLDMFGKVLRRLHLRGVYHRREGLENTWTGDVLAGVAQIGDRGEIGRSVCVSVGAYVCVCVEARNCRRGQSAVWSCVRSCVSWCCSYLATEIHGAVGLSPLLWWTSQPGAFVPLRDNINFK